MKLLRNTGRQLAKVLLVCGLLSVTGVPSVLAQFSQVITMDENGTAYITSSLPFPFAVTPEPISGMSTLMYSLPIPGVAGDVLITSTQSGSLSELLRFDGAGNVWFFSDANDGIPSLADVPMLPAPISPTIGVFEQNGQAMYIPITGQPGYGGAATPVSYLILCQPVPEPGAIWLAGLGGLLLFSWPRRAK